MNIIHTQISIPELTENYEDNDEAEVPGFGERLNIRPPCQREFVYKDKQRDAVIDTVIREFPLNTMYRAVTDDGFEIIDGQQRTVSICQYVCGDFSFKDHYFHNLHKDEKEKILNYMLTVCQYQGNDSEKPDWFRTINISGEKLTDQELRNAVYAGYRTADATRYFSVRRTNWQKSMLPEHLFGRNIWKRRCNGFLLVGLKAICLLICPDLADNRINGNDMTSSGITAA